MTDHSIVSVIDVGSNSVRLLAARQLSPSAFEVVDEERFDARLGEGQDGALSEAAIERGLRAMRVCAGIAASFGPVATVAVGTEALRRATNAGAFVDAVREQTGIAVRVLSSEEEAFASFLGVVNSTLLRHGNIVDIGGGSLELMSVRDRSLVEARSAPLGAIYARDRYLRSDPPAGRELRTLRKAVRQQLAGATPAPELVGVGGAVRNLARIVRLRRRYPLRRIHGLTLERREVRRLAETLAGASTDDRRRMSGVSSNRADILHAAAVVIDEVMSMTGAESLTVSGQGLREGLVWQVLRGEGGVLPDVRAASIAGLARANGVDALAAEPVVAVAGELFAALEPAHGLGQEDLGLLLDAARLAGVGMHIDYYDRDRHAEYLVHSGDLHGFSHREIVLLGALVRCADSGTPDLSPYGRLVAPDDARRVGILAALLGVARTARRRMPSPLFRVRPELRGDSLLLTLSGGDALEPEVLALERQQKRFEAALRLRLVVTTSSGKR